MKRRHFSVARKAQIVAYYHEHGAGATMEKYKLGSSILHRWKHEIPGDRSPRPAAPPEGIRANGSAVRDALVYLGHAEMEIIRRGGSPTNVDLYALLALRVLQGEIK